MDINYMKTEQKKSPQEVLHAILYIVKHFNYRLPDIDFDKVTIGDLLNGGMPMSYKVYYGIGLILETSSNFRTEEPEITVTLIDGAKVAYFKYCFNNSTNMVEAIQKYPFIETVMNTI